MTSRNHRTPFLWVFLLYSLFVLYGSIVPLHFHHLSLAEAVRIFKDLEILPLHACSRMDLTTNVLLGMPVSFFAMSYFYNQNRLFNKLLVPLFILFFSLVLASTAEFLQIFFSSRNPSKNDILAQLTGAGIGIFIWFVFGASLRRSVAEFITTRLFDKKIYFLFSAYVLFLFIYDIMPLDLSLHPIDIYRKWNQGRINVIPFGFKTDSFSMLVYNMGIDILKWAPISFFLIHFKRVRIPSALFFVLGIAFFIEFVQLFVLTRITDITDLITAFIGGSLGALLTKAFKNRGQPHPGVQKKRPLKLGIGIMAMLCWMIVLIFINWFPFDFTFEKASIKQHLDRISLVPFRYYQLNDTYFAITTVFRKIIMFIPGGLIISYMVKDGRRYSHTANTIIIFVFSLLVAGWSVIIEIGQFLLPGKVPDITDLLLAVCGAFIGYWSLKQLYIFRKK